MAIIGAVLRAAGTLENNVAALIKSNKDSAVSFFLLKFFLIWIDWGSSLVSISKTNPVEISIGFIERLRLAIFALITFFLIHFIRVLWYFLLITSLSNFLIMTDQLFTIFLLTLFLR